MRKLSTNGGFKRGTKKATDRRQAKSVDKQNIYEVSIS